MVAHEGIDADSKHGWKASKIHWCGADMYPLKDVIESNDNH